MSIFSKVKMTRPKLNKFDLSHERKFSLKMGNLYPIMCQEIIPGDKFRVSSEIFLRMAPMLAPIMHRVNVYTHYFFVPNRLVWTDWEKFITGGKDGTETAAPPTLSYGPTTTALGYQEFWKPGSLADFFRVPVVSTDDMPVANSINISALPFRAYQLIYNEYFRDQNLSNPIAFSKASGAVNQTASDYGTLLNMRKRCWEKDRYTSALPWAQRGSEVLMPMEGIATNSDITYKDAIGSPWPPSGVQNLQILPSGAGAGTIHSATNEGPIQIDNIEEIAIQNTSITINDLRRSIKLQEWLEKNARGGARYIEQILSHFGVMSSDARLQRPEYLGGGKSPVVISEVLSTFQEASGNPQGNMSGHGVSVGNTNGFKRGFEEHGFVIGIMSVLPRTAYMQGIPKHMRVRDKFEYAWPSLANLGEEIVKTSELYYNPLGSDDQDETFGYQSRYSDYKFVDSSVHGDMRTTLNYWHMGRIFDTKPSLNETFVNANPTDRIFAVEDPDVDKMYCQLYNSVSALRPLPYFGTPTL